MQLQGVLGMEGLFKQLDQLYGMKNLDIRFYPFWKFKNWFTISYNISL
jgi:hypothetical protein